jgi:membrane protein involved in colicin uptake
MSFKDKLEKISLEYLRENYQNDTQMKNIIEFFDYVVDQQAKIKKDQQRRSKAYYQTEKGREKVKASQKRYYEKNKEKIKAKYHKKKQEYLRLKKEEQKKNNNNIIEALNKEDE